jgi:hypothetical protein
MFDFVFFIIRGTHVRHKNLGNKNKIGEDI